MSTTTAASCPHGESGRDMCWHCRRSDEARVDRRLTEPQALHAKTSLCLSVQQPYAWLLVNGLKDVENRDWTTKVRGWIGIHASKTLDTLAVREVAAAFPHIALPATYDLGGIVGRVRLIDCVESLDSPWFSGRYGFVVRDAEALPFCPCRGQLRFFRPTLSTVAT